MNASTAKAVSTSNPGASDIGQVSLAAFADDDETRAILAAATAGNWPSADIKAGGVGAATEYLRDGSAPDLLVVDLGDSEKPFDDLMALSEFCDPATQVIAIGMVNDLVLYRQIIGAGVSDYLVKPVSSDDLVLALTKAATNKVEPVTENAESTKAVIVVGARGGVGASLVAANGAWLMAEVLDKKTVLLDLDLQFGTSALALDVLPAGGLVEALQHPSRVDSLFMASAITPKTKKLSILAAEDDLGRDAHFEQEGFDMMLNALTGSFEWIWIDVPRSSFGQLGNSLDNIQQIIIVSDLSLAGMRDTLRFKTFCKGRAPHVDVAVVLNRVDSSHGDGLTMAQFERGIETKVTCQIGEDHKNAAAASTAGKPLAELTHKKKQLSDFKTFVSSIAGIATEPVAKKKGFLARAKRG